MPLEYFFFFPLMEIIEHINKYKEIYLSLMNFLEITDDKDKDQEFQQFVELLEKILYYQTSNKSVNY